jgi:pimeloyl-ACP methyl ester carboxylesterase
MAPVYTRCIRRGNSDRQPRSIHVAADIIRAVGEHHELRLPDGRTLEVAISGPDGGPLLVHQHGTPGGAHQPRGVATLAHERGLRLLTFSRPGYAGSTRRPGRTVADVAADVAAVLDAVSVDRAYIAGVSGGGPHALASAALLPDRISAALVAAGIGPADADDLDFSAGMGQSNLDEFGAAFESEQSLREFLDQEATALEGCTPRQLVDRWQSMLPDVDRACIDSEVGADVVAGLHHALSRGVDGWVDDDIAFVRPWAFDLAAIRVPVTLWHGGADLMVPFSHGQWLAKRIPGVVAHLDAVEGHFSVRLTHMAEMLDELVNLGRS